MDMGSTKQITLEERSEIIKKACFELLHSFDNFLSQPKPTEGEMKAPAPKLDALAQINENLLQAENALKETAGQFARLKARIRA